MVFNIIITIFGTIVGLVSLAILENIAYQSSILVGILALLNPFVGSKFATLSVAISAMLLLNGDITFRIISFLGLVLFIVIYNYFVEKGYKEGENKSLVQFTFIGIGLGLLAKNIIFFFLGYPVETIVLDLIAAVAGVFMVSYLGPIIKKYKK
ncbi:hypothetical protein HYG86_10630 [Alkalicella caledoniensis]|uniref:Uncharacterized protein n=1 Tax=Alkalicella caledoniensis TaxID=2731377 RepID=A0A7G9W922_ALKCA|nr:hypothetical protein [Alkalicella caledoniensis]QNO15184.1 hypothetical protein HYG86_10630 [Alkalicella caledoniensis]